MLACHLVQSSIQRPEAGVESYSEILVCQSVKKSIECLKFRDARIVT